MAYNVQYFLPFTDFMGAPWRIDLSLKDGAMQPNPVQMTGTGSPLSLDKRNNGESLFTAVVPTVCTINYVVTSDNDPQPEIFFDTESDTWMVSVYKDGVLYWRGFMDGKSSNYSWMPYPYTFTLTASDFDFMKGIPANVNLSGLLYYDFVTIGDFLNRTLLQSLPYEGVIKVSYSRTPQSISPLTITEGVYIHTDAIYNFLKGPANVYESIEIFARSLGARWFFEEGSYWLQFISDIGMSPQNVITISADNVTGTTDSVAGLFSWMGNTSFDTVVYRDGSQEVVLNRGLKSKLFSYDLKTINKVKNFDWRTDMQSPFDDWEGDTTGFFQRVGDGSAEDIYKLRIPDFTAPGARSIWSRIPVRVGQRVRVNLKSKPFLTLGGPSTNRFEVFTKSLVLLVEAGTIGTLQQRYLTAGGQWSTGSGSAGGSGENEYYHVGGNPATAEIGQLDILSDPIPALEGVSNYELLLLVYDSGINENPPPGSNYYTEFYPPFLGIYDSVYTKYEESIVNNGKLSLVDSDETMFYLDNGQDAYSNTLYYNNGSAFVPIPNNDWTGSKTIDEIAVRQYVDIQARTTNSVMGAFMSNQLTFQDGVFLRDKAGMRTGIVRDNYNVAESSHSLMCQQVLPEGSANATYTVTPIKT